MSAELRDRGAEMTGFDGSPGMIELARRRLGDDVPLTVADLAQPLPYADDAFDDVVASLVLHYLEDWQPPLAELHRVLRPGGRLILSVNHPLARPLLFPDEGYFGVRQFSDEFEFAGQPGTLTFWHRPLHAMSDDFTAAGFQIASIAEPPPSPDTPAELLPPRIASGERTAFVSFLFFVLEAR
ncbi:class I SAM-dependent methyltransferase [Promicromonospora sp. NPDC057138]|uniref:class I SAM-dependent methyltransferase n=1 Tax=Promicromonospora sp. NPDC057138 TaxID=3346031 RepID=UPI00363E0419